MIPAGALAEVRDVFDRCRRRYPTIELPFEAFLARIEQVVSSQADSSRAIESDSWLACFIRIQHEDLFLATACAQGDRVAWEYFADDYLPVVRSYSLKACRNFHEGEDLAQQILTTFLEDRKKLGGYSGRGSLAGWLRVAIAHAAIDRFRRAARQVSLDGMQEDGASPAPAPACPQQTENRPDSRWGPVLCRILAGEILRLRARERLLLSLYYVQSVPLKMIGRHFQVHEATASRWLEGLRHSLRKSIERELRVRHGLKPQEIESLWIWASEAESFSLEKVLGKG